MSAVGGTDNSNFSILPVKALKIDGGLAIKPEFAQHFARQPAKGMGLVKGAGGATSHRKPISERRRSEREEYAAHGAAQGVDAQPRATFCGEILNHR